MPRVAKKETNVVDEKTFLRMCDVVEQLVLVTWQIQKTVYENKSEISVKGDGMSEIVINNWKLLSNPNGLNGEWVTAGEIGKHLGYADPGDSINKIYERNRDFFKDGVDTCTVKLTVQTQAREVRIFSERGTLKVLRYSKTELADKVMEEVFDVFLAARKNDASLEDRFKKYENHPMVVRKRQVDEILIAQIEMEDRQRRLEVEQQEQKQAMMEIKAKTDAVLYQSNYFSIIGYANLQEIRIDLHTAASLGKLATKIAKDMGMTVKKVSDPRFGEVNIYHKDVLEIVFNSLGR